MLARGLLGEETTQLLSALQRLAGGTGPAGGYRIRPPWLASLPATDHTLAVAETYVRLIEAERRNELRLLDFAAEPTSWRRYLGRGGALTTIKPDAAVQTAPPAGDALDFWFIEMDRGTQSSLTITRKADAYRRYFSSGQEQARHGVFPRVLFIVPDTRRYSVLVDTLGHQPADSWRLFAVCTFDDAVSRIEQGGEA